MPLKRYAIIDKDPESMAVVDIIEINDEPGSDEHEDLVVSEAYHAIQHDEAEIGWIWNGKRTLKEPQA
jgi:hypothetical protein